MGKGNPYLPVECDQCSCVIEISLTATAHGYDERYVDDELEDEGWIVDDGLIFCSDDCREDYYTLLGDE